MSRALALAALAAGSAGWACSTAIDGLPPATSAWSLGPTMPRRALDPGVAALGLSLVVAGGFDTGQGADITARVDVFDTTAGAWGALPDLPVRWTAINLAAVGNTLYVAGGLDAQGVAHGETFSLDPVERTWHALPAMPPGDERGASGVVAAPGHLYLLGGASSTVALATCLEYDVAARTWRRLPDLPEPRSHPAAMRRADGTLIVAGGFASLDASEPRGDVWALPPSDAVPRGWAPRLAMPSPRGGCAYGVVLGQLVCAGGADGQSATRVIESYDPYLDVWSQGLEPMPEPRVGTPGAAVGGRLFVPGGATTLALDPTNTLYIHAPLDTAPR